MTTLTIKNIGVKSPNETRLVGVSFSGCLDSGETLTGTPTVTCTGLTLGSKQVSSTALTIDGVSVPSAEAVTFTVAAGTAGTKYTITIVVGTTAGQTLERFVILQVASS